MGNREIVVEKDPSGERLEELGVRSWPTWEAGVSEFPWTYDVEETCWFLEGDVIVTPENGDPVRIGRGDLVTFPAGLSCTWKILSPVRKHYRLG